MRAPINYKPNWQRELAPNMGRRRRGKVSETGPIWTPQILIFCHHSVYCKGGRLPPKRKSAWRILGSPLGTSKVKLMLGNFARPPTNPHLHSSLTPLLLHPADGASVAWEDKPRPLFLLPSLGAGLPGGLFHSSFWLWNGCAWVLR